MPDAQCDICKKSLGDICHNQINIDKLSKIIKERSTKIMGVITNISPGIHHNEVDNESECDGTLWYKALWSTPPGVKWS